MKDACVRQEKSYLNPIFRRMRRINAAMVQCFFCCFFLPGGLLDSQEPSEHKVYILRAKKRKTALKKKTKTMFQPLFTDSLFFIIDQC